MKRSHRIILTTAAASTLAAGAGSALALVPADSQASSVPVMQTSESTTDPTALHDAVDRLTGQTAALEAELAKARERLGDAQRQAGTTTVTPPTPARGSAPAVHARTGASGGGGGEDHEHDGRDDD